MQQIASFFPDFREFFSGAHSSMSVFVREWLVQVRLCPHKALVQSVKKINENRFIALVVNRNAIIFSLVRGKTVLET